MPAKRKPPTQRQDNRPTRQRHLEVVKPGKKPAVRKPALPANLRATTKKLWDAFWSSEIAAAITPEMHGAVLRWIRTYDQWVRAMDVVEKEPFVTGSQGQPVKNPLMDWISSRETELARLERDFGLTIKARADLGISVGQAQMTAHQLNQMIQEPEAGGHDTEEASAAIDVEARELAQEFGEEGGR